MASTWATNCVSQDEEVPPTNLVHRQTKVLDIHGPVASKSLEELKLSGFGIVSVDLRVDGCASLGIRIVGHRYIIGVIDPKGLQATGIGAGNRSQALETSSHPLKVGTLTLLGARSRIECLQKGQLLAANPQIHSPHLDPREILHSSNPGVGGQLVDGRSFACQLYWLGEVVAQGYITTAGKGQAVQGHRLGSGQLKQELVLLLVLVPGVDGEMTQSRGILVQGRGILDSGQLEDADVQREGHRHRGHSRQAIETEACWNRILSCVTLACLGFVGRKLRPSPAD